MNVIFFGAGASKGSDSSNVPPLGNALFGELVRHDPRGWGRLPPPWATQFQQTNGFEQAMQAFISSGQFGSPLQWAMADYFFKNFPISNSNRYLALMNDLKPHTSRFAVVTINYDTLLFQAASRTKTQLALGAATHPGQQLPVCLPHGSCVLCCQGISATSGVSFTGGVSTSGQPRVFVDVADFDREKASNVFPPIMSYYEPNKFTVSCANVIAQERAIYAQWIRQAEKIAVIGVNVHPADRHIWDSLSNTSAQIFYLSGKSGVQGFHNWAVSVGRTVDIVCDKHFAGGYADLKTFLGI